MALSGVVLRSGAWLCSSAEAVDIKARVLIVARVAAAARTLYERATLQILRATVAYGRRYPTKLGLRHAATKPFWRIADAVVFQFIPQLPEEMLPARLTES